ncbi:UDP-glucose/GDP-mannose dehydrogenase family protein [Oligoflexaceae bacterium]|nr:UDP-glucose/GDP-mannose dehydrogenase family protein [Oligoflexaceae bacterium]
MNITVIGTGYVGLVTGTCLAEYGHQVACIDTDPNKIEMLNSGRSPIFEPGIETLLVNNMKRGHLLFSTDLADHLPNSSAVFIAVGTPEGEDGSADLKYVEAVAKTIGQLADKNLLVIVKSTVPVGTCDRVEKIIADEQKSKGRSWQITVASNPEFLKEGGAIDDFMKPDRIVCGLNGKKGAEQLEELYRPFVIDDPSKLMIIDRRSSEMTKYGSNAMLATRISFMNELSRMADEWGANIDHIRIGMGSDPRIGKKFLYAGPGYGGSCFPKDVSALIQTAERSGKANKVLKAVTEANEDQKKYAADIVCGAYESLAGRTLAVWGLSFKPGTDDVREAPAATIIRQLLEKGAKVIAHDPEASQNFMEQYPHQDLQVVESAYDAVENADGLVLITEWGEYRRPDFKRLKETMKTPKIFDLRNQYDFENLKSMGFNYYCIGRPDSRRVN